VAILSLLLFSGKNPIAFDKDKHCFLKKEIINMKKKVKISKTGAKLFW
jgi:hypothetical protein